MSHHSYTQIDFVVQFADDKLVGHRDICIFSYANEPTFGAALSRALEAFGQTYNRPGYRLIRRLTYTCTEIIVEGDSCGSC